MSDKKDPKDTTSGDGSGPPFDSEDIPPGAEQQGRDAANRARKESREQSSEESSKDDDDDKNDKEK